MPRLARTQQSCWDAPLFSMANVIHIIFLLLYCDTIHSETTSLPELNPVITIRKDLSRGQSHVKVIEEPAVLSPQTIELLCNLSDIPNNPPSVTGYWTKDGQEIENSKETVNRNNDQYIFKKTIQAADVGNYSCVFRENDAQVTFVFDVPVMKDKRDKPIVSYTGDTVALKCTLKHIPKTWSWYKVNNTEKDLINVTASPLKYNIIIHKNVTKLSVLNLTEADAGVYICSAEFDIKPIESQVELRVLSFLEPLKPFLVIVVEVIVLVTLILVWEKCKTRQDHNTATTENDVYPEQTSKLTHSDSNGMETTTRQRKLEQ
ncbi:embigin [Triplophysa rosa]|uniref:Embigin n=1 Tax=Triplophysa rosa TaxID=992332 RepID=A0A9W8CAI3_TRIRA|nr:embigin [Triplophysa rosa]KAI7812622.1 embigin precursor [Triplophysa rosa]